MKSFSLDSRAGGEFMSTCWSVICAARGHSPEARLALESLCRSYWYPLYVFIRRRGHAAHDAQDLTQGFLTRLLAKDDLAQVDPAMGRFRNWLLAACKNFLKNEYDRAHAQKRWPKNGLAPLDFEVAESRYSHEPAHVDTAEALFTRRWALTLLEEVLAQLEIEAARGGKQELLELLKPALMGDPGAARYAQVAVAYDMTEGAVKVAVHRLRKRFRALLEAEIARTVEEPGQIDEEIRELFTALSA